MIKVGFGLEEIRIPTQSKGSHRGQTWHSNGVRAWHGANAMAEPSKWRIEGASALQKFTLPDSFPIYHLSISYKIYKNSMQSIYAPLKNRTAPDGGVFFHKQIVKHTGIYSVL